jgi:hypothetical protein
MGLSTTPTTNYAALFAPTLSKIISSFTYMSLDIFC